MLEAQVEQASLWKRLIDCISGLVSAANFDCNPGGLSIQAMDTSHVALVHLYLRDDCFTKYQCERNSLLGLNLESLSRVLKIVDGSDGLTLHHEDDSDVIILTSENSERTRKCEYQLKLLEIEEAAMSMPDLEYVSVVTLSSQEFAKIVRDMSVFGETVTIHIAKEGVKFSSSGNVGEGYAFLRATGVPEQSVKHASEVKEEEDDTPISGVSASKAKNGSTGIGVEVRTDEPVTLSFALRFMNVFAKGATLSDRVSLKFIPASPCMVEFNIDQLGYLRYFLAPKMDDTM